MKNREKYANELIECALSADATGIKDGKPIPCKDIFCRECGLDNVCSALDNEEMLEALHAWAEAEAET